jgi:hypothetical protein
MMAHTADDRPPCPGSMSERAKRNDWTEEELEALGFASEMGGRYVEQVGRTDLREWSPDEWQMLTNLITLAFTERLRELTTSDDVPF